MRIVMLFLDRSRARHAAEDEQFGILSADGRKALEHVGIIYLTTSVAVGLRAIYISLYSR